MAESFAAHRLYRFVQEVVANAAKKAARNELSCIQLWSRGVHGRTARWHRIQPYNVMTSLY